MSLGPFGLFALLGLAALVGLLGGLVIGARWPTRTERVPPAAAPSAAPQVPRATLIAAERERIYADLHDDLGAKLLDLVHLAQSHEQADLARAALQDLRDVVSRSRGAPGTLTQTLGEIRAEAEQRLAAGGVALAWQQPGDLPDPPLDHGHALHLYRIVREALTNALRHARAQTVRIRVTALGPGQLLMEITDDGAGTPGAPGGAGTAGMRQRAVDLQGSIDWQRGTLGGTKVVLQIPLPGAAQRP